ncbi:MAG: nuclear transport factor 2 family protein [Woeseiaceae bacterium]
MSSSSKQMGERDAVADTLRHYIGGARSGRGEDMRPAFHENATVFGYVSDNLFAGPIETLFDWSDANWPKLRDKHPAEIS